MDVRGPTLQRVDVRIAAEDRPLHRPDVRAGEALIPLLGALLVKPQMLPQIMFHR